MKIIKILNFLIGLAGVSYVCYSWKYGIYSMVFVMSRLFLSKDFIRWCSDIKDIIKNFLIKNKFSKLISKPLSRMDTMFSCGFFSLFTSCFKPKAPTEPTNVYPLSNLTSQHFRRNTVNTNPSLTDTNYTNTLLSARTDNTSQGQVPSATTGDSPWGYQLSVLQTSDTTYTNTLLSVSAGNSSQGQVPSPTTGDSPRDSQLSVIQSTATNPANANTSNSSIPNPNSTNPVLVQGGNDPLTSLAFQRDGGGQSTGGIGGSQVRSSTPNLQTTDLVVQSTKNLGQVPNNPALHTPKDGESTGHFLPRILEEIDIPDS